MNYLKGTRSEDEETMEGPPNNKERRRYPRISINFPLKYQDKGDSSLCGGIVVNVGEGGLLIETVRDIPVGTELSITLLFPKGFESANFDATVKIVWRGPRWKGDRKGNEYWEGYRCGLEFTQISDEDRWKLNYLLGSWFESDEPLLSLSCQSKRMGGDGKA